MRSRNGVIKWFVLGMLFGMVIGNCVGCSPVVGPVNEFPCGPKVLVFHAKWCQYCPTDAQINALQKAFPHCEVVNLDVDKYPQMAAQYHVTKVPEFVVLGEDEPRLTNSFGELKSWLHELGCDQ